MASGFDIELAIVDEEEKAHPACLLFPKKAEAEIGERKGGASGGGGLVYEDAFNAEIGSKGPITCCAWKLDCVHSGIKKAREMAQAKGFDIRVGDCIPVAAGHRKHWPSSVYQSGCNPTRSVFAGGEEHPVFGSDEAYQESLFKYGTCLGAHIHLDFTGDHLLVAERVMKSVLPMAMLCCWDKGTQERFQLLGAGNFRTWKNGSVLELKDFGSGILRNPAIIAFAIQMCRFFTNYSGSSTLFREVDKIPKGDVLRALQEGNISYLRGIAEDVLSLNYPRLANEGQEVELREGSLLWDFTKGEERRCPYRKITTKTLEAVPPRTGLRAMWDKNPTLPLDVAWDDAENHDHTLGFESGLAKLGALE